MAKIMAKNVWKSAMFRLIPLFAMIVIGATIAFENSRIRPVHLKSGSLVVLGVLLYLAASTSFLHVVTKAFYQISKHRIGVGRAAMIRFILRLGGYIVIGLGLLTILHISIVSLLLGGAIVGIIVSVAAQQSLANFFASIIIVLDRPFTVGQVITITAGALGGSYTGKVMDISFSRTRLRLEDESMITMPNAILVSGAAVITKKESPAPEKPASK